MTQNKLNKNKLTPQVKKEINCILITLNSTKFFKYPIGNNELMQKVIKLETSKIIKYNDYTNTWELTK